MRCRGDVQNAFMFTTAVTNRSRALLEFRVYRFHLKATGAGVLPNFVTNTVRGAFGFALRRLVCTFPGVECGSCELAGSCPYAAVFEPRKPPQVHRLAQVRQTPRPFVLRTETAGGRVSAGSELLFEMVLVGGTKRLLPYITLAIRNMAAEGIGVRNHRASFSLEEVRAKTKRGWSRVYSPEKGLRTTAAHPFRYSDFVAASRPCKRITVRFLSPLRIRTRSGGLIRRNLRFEHLVKRLRDRLNMLSVFYCGRELPLDFRGLGERAGKVETARSDLRWVDVSRYSRSQKQRHPMGGLLGEVTFVGDDLGEFLPLLYAGEYLHVGRFAVWGFGQIEVVSVE